MTVKDDDKAAFNVSVSSATVTEGETVQVIVTTIDDVTFASEQTLTLAFSGNAEQGTDYTVESDTLTLAAGQTAVTTLLHVLDDGAKEPEETIGITAHHDGTQSESQPLTIAASEDTEPPTFDHAEVPPDGRSLILTFSEPLAEAAHHQPAATAFTVTVAGEPRAVTSVTVSGAQVVLELTSPVRPGQAVTVRYTMPAGHPAPPVLQDPAGHAVESFSAEPVKNDSQFGRRPPAASAAQWRRWGSRLCGGLTRQHRCAGHRPGIGHRDRRGDLSRRRCRLFYAHRPRAGSGLCGHDR